MEKNNETAPVPYKGHTTEYLVVFAALTILTILELSIPGREISYPIKAASLIGLAVSKAFVVAYFYMHLKEERPWLKFIAAVPVSAALFAIVIILESMYR